MSSLGKRAARASEFISVPGAMRKNVVLSHKRSAKAGK